jgi:predicted Zn-dependent peptidase
VSPAKRGGGAELARTEYSSGLRVVTERMPEMRSVALGIWVSVGSREERPEIAGTSHFLEHLLFKGTKKRSARDIAEAFDAVGGDLNAFSAKEYTCYYCRVLDRDLPMAVEFMSDMIQHSTIAKADVETERNVILEEINMRDDDPGDLIHDLFAETLWKGHPLGRPVLGTRQTIGAVTRDQVKRFYSGRYGPPRFVVAAAGNLEHDGLCALIQKQMDTGRKLSRSSTPKGRDAGDVPIASGETLVHKRKTEQAHICLGANGYSRSHPDRFAFGVVNTALGGGMSSRLFQEVREKRALAYAVGSYHSSFAEIGMFCAYAGTTPSRATETLTVMRGQIEDVAEKGLLPDELDRAKGHMKGSLVLSLEDTSGRMSRIGKSEIGHGEILSVDEALARVDAVTPEDASRVAADVLAKPMTLTVVGPFGPRDFRT